MSEWRPIATAPKDEEILVYEGRTGQIEIVDWSDIEEGKWLSRDYDRIEATHWMPLPAPPSPASDPSQVEAFQGE